MARWVEVTDTKVCQCGCGLEYERQPNIVQPNWERQKYFSLAHARYAAECRRRERVALRQNKKCKFCKAIFQKPPGQHNNTWKRQEYCCKEHQIAAANKRRDEREKRRRRDKRRATVKAANNQALQAFLCASTQWEPLVKRISWGFTHEI